MSVTRRFIILAAFGLPLLVLSVFTIAPVFVFITFNAIIFGLLTLDFIVSLKSSGSQIEIRTVADDKLYFKADNEIIFYVRNNSARILKLCLKDSIPDRHFTIIEASDLKGIVKPDIEAVLRYTIRPAKRGAFIFPKVYGYVYSVMGFCRLYFERDLPREYKVYPNLRDLSRYRLITRNKRLLPAGERTLRLRGLGTEFESLREYIEGDDFRRINWMATARENKIIVNQYQIEKNQPIFTLIDAGRPMSYSVKGYKKLDYAINAALILSDIVNQQGDNSGLMVFDTSVHACILPGKGDTHRNRLMEALYHIQDTKSASDYEGAFMELINRQKRQGLVFLFTDFETPEQAEELAANIQMIKKRHTPFIVLMENDSLNRMAAENGDHDKQTAYQRAVAIEFLEKRKAMIKNLNARGVACLESPAEDFALTAVNSYLMARR
ncbi:MAG: DUF58 domain-containing protein [Clostridiales bacterium]|jgi:uncharacterized protein (DUF58 family)|nr:DUF58 domain-containing protein [Clostridiales bacterium]